MSIVRQSVKRLLTACLPRDRWLVRGGRAHGMTGSAISLTFDDGPHPVQTPKVLDRLHEQGWRATFFVVGERAEQHPELIRRIVAEGHELGNHTWTHGEPSRTSPAQFEAEMLATRQLLQRICGRDVLLFRPPKGELSLKKMRIAWQQKQTVVLWNVDPKDYRPDAQSAVANWAANYAPRHGDIVLLHDSSPQSVTALDTLIAHSRLAGVKTTTVSAWLSRTVQMAPVESTSLNLEYLVGSAPCP